MASFVEDLWSSVFTPGTTPTLLVATNASFAALQLVLFVLLLATYSVHFIVLSFLCAALWWSINWFAAEVNAAQARLERDPSSSSSFQPRRGQGPGTGAVDVATESETETEGFGAGAPKPTRRGPPPSGKATVSRPVPEDSSGDELRQRYSAMESSGYISTDSDWEKVDEKDR